MPHYFGVDIGNSGLRVSELDVEQGRLGNTWRIVWQHPFQGDSDLGAAASLDDANWSSVARYRPADRAWLAELERLPCRDGQVKWLVSSVRRDALEVLLEYLHRQADTCVQVVDRSHVDLEVNVAQPEQVGIDRLLAASAAAQLSSSRPLLVIQAGSAVTVDLLTGHPRRLGTFEGGAIVPGVPMMLRLLGQAADQLPEIDADDLTDLPSLPGKNTAGAMTCGAASALVGGVQHLVARYRGNFQQSLPVILSGGDGMRIAGYIPEPVEVEPHLVQRGLLGLAMR